MSFNYSLASKPPTEKIRPDPVPHIRDAGKLIATNGHNADVCVRQEIFGNEGRGNAGTPPHILKYRKLHNYNPGQIQVHPGLQDLKQNVGEGHAYGRPNFLSDHVNETIRAQNLVGLADKFNDIREGAYASQKREPLGKSITRSYNWPAAAEKGAATFGCPTKDSANAK
jgi:EF-hand domain-containing family member B